MTTHGSVFGFIIIEGLKLSEFNLACECQWSLCLVCWNVATPSKFVLLVFLSSTLFTFFFPIEIGAVGMTCLLLSVHQVSMKLPFCFVFALYHLVSCDGTIILGLIKVLFFLSLKKVHVYLCTFMSICFFFFYCLLLLRHMLNPW